MPELKSQTGVGVDALVGQVADEFTQRIERGENPTIEEYAEKHPEIAGLLREVLRALCYIRRPEVESAIVNADPYLGSRLGDFRLLRQIGAGGMGVVYEAEQSFPKRKVAVKILAGGSALDPRLIKRFQNEAEAAGNLRHPHIVPVHCVGCDRGIHYYAMQLVDGVSLADIILEMRRQSGLETAQPDQTLPFVLSRLSDSDTSPVAALTLPGSRHTAQYFDSVARLGMQAAEGLEHTHHISIVHRDIKPANLLVDNECSLWIADFGLAVMRDDIGLTRTGELVGTLRYMSPEQTLAKRVPVDHRTDIYSLGATLYELLTLEPPFRGSDRQELLRRILIEDPAPPRRLNAQVPRDLETIVLTSMAKSPNARYRTAKEMADDLQRFLNREPIRAKPEPLQWRLWRKVRQRSASVLVGLAAVISAAVLIGALLVQRPNHVDTNLSPDEGTKLRQQEALAELTKTLDAGKRVDAIGPIGSPAYFRWRSDETNGKIVSAPDGSFSIQHWGIGLVEIAPDPRHDSYRFSADVRQERHPHQEGEAGIYFCSCIAADDPTKAYYYCTVSFNDLVRQVAENKTNHLRLVAHGLLPSGLDNTANVGPDVAEFEPITDLEVPRPWRHIEVVVRLGSIEINWEGKQVATRSRQTLMRDARNLTTEPNKPLLFGPEFLPRGGLGLFVKYGVASFKNVTFEPIK